MPRVTADTNIYISGLNFQGKAFDFLELARSGAIELAISEPILMEIRRVLTNKFRWSQEEIAVVERRISRYAHYVEPQQTLAIVKNDPSDDRILECAAAAHSDFIVTGDNHLLELQQFGEIRILKLADFLETEMGRGGQRPT